MMEVGDYVRTIDGYIGKILEIKKSRRECDTYYVTDTTMASGFYESIYKHSKQLIDLVEVKDLICFKNKLQNSLENKEMIIHIFDKETLEEVKQAIKKGEIELLEILTHEQFEHNSYKVGGEE